MHYSLIISLCLLTASHAFAATPAAISGETLAVIPFDNLSKAPGIEWIGESFPQTLLDCLTSSTLYVLPREDRLRAYDREGIPAEVHASRATLYRMAEQMDVDYLALGSYTFDGQTFLAKAQLLDLRRERLLPEVAESGPLPSLRDIQAALAWDLLRTMRPGISTTRHEFVSAVSGSRLDAFEHFVRGAMASDAQEQIRHFREAVRLDPDYSEALLHLGMTYYRERQYEQAVAFLSRVLRNSPLARQSSFYLGLAAYTQGDFERAEEAFQFVASQMPLSEVYNNLGVAASRRGKKEAVRYLQKAVDADPGDADYRFNLAVEFCRAGDTASAARELRQAVVLRPADSEAKALLETLNDHAAPASSPPIKLPAERLRRNYDESSFRQLAFIIEAANEQRLAKSDLPTRARFHAARGHDLLMQGFSTQADAEFREAIQNDPLNPDGHAGLARVLEIENDAPTARSEAETATRLKPSVESLLVLARLDLRENKPEAAIQEIERALQLDPGSEPARELQHTVAAMLSATPALKN